MFKWIAIVVLVVTCAYVIESVTDRRALMSAEGQVVTQTKKLARTLAAESLDRGEFALLSPYLGVEGILGENGIPARFFDESGLPGEVSRKHYGIFLEAFNSVVLEASNHEPFSRRKFTDWDPISIQREIDKGEFKTLQRVGTDCVFQEEMVTVVLKPWKTKTPMRSVYWDGRFKRVEIDGFDGQNHFAVADNGRVLIHRKENADWVIALEDQYMGQLLCWYAPLRR